MTYSLTDPIAGRLDQLTKVVNELLDRIENGQRQSIGSIDNVRAVQFGMDEIAQYREAVRAALRAQPAPPDQGDAPENTRDHPKSWAAWKRRAEAAERTVTSLATMLGWENVPPQHILEADLSALKARAKEFAALRAQPAKCEICERVGILPSEAVACFVHSSDYLKEWTDSNAEGVIETLIANYDDDDTKEACELIRGLVQRIAQLEAALRAQPAPPDDSALIEVLAAWDHQAWAKWTRWLLDYSTPENIARWRRQIETPYADLSEAEKESDRNEAREILAAIRRLASKPTRRVALPIIQRWRQTSANKPDVSGRPLRIVARLRSPPRGPATGRLHDAKG